MNMPINKQLIEFINQSPTAFHAVEQISKILRESGFLEISENTQWNLKRGKSYYTIRNGSSLIAFRIPEEQFHGYQIIASHSDSPSFKIKPAPEIEVEGEYLKLNVEKYGGMLMAPWMDRPLSAAGRLLLEAEQGVESRLLNIDRDILLIPNLAIHMNREINEGYRYNAQKDMLPLYGQGQEKGAFMNMIAKEAGVSVDSILGMDLMLYNRQCGMLWGAEQEFVSAPRLDDLECAFLSIKGLTECSSGKSVAMCAVFDNEEVGSTTKQGAASTFLQDVLKRIALCFEKNEEEHMVDLRNSFMISADNAHAVHPNYTEKTDPTNRPYLNKGIVIKYNANQKYTTDGVSEALFKVICRNAGVPYQTFTNRSDMAGGSTLGNISNTQISLNTVDIGLAQLAMHSPYETAGARDTEYFKRMAEEFFETSFTGTENNNYVIQK